MERTDTLIKQLRQLRNSSVHGIGSISPLPYRSLLLWALREYFIAFPNSSPLARNIRTALESDELSSFEERRQTISAAVGSEFQSFEKGELLQIVRALFHEYLKEFSDSLEYSTHYSVNHELVKLITTEPNATIYDPACGVGQTFVLLHNRYPNHNLKFIGQEVNREIGLLCQVNLLVNGIENAEIEIADSIETPYEGQADIAISDPPLNPLSKLGNSLLTQRFIGTMLKVVGEDGIVICRVPDSFLIQNAARKFREELLNQDLVESVISLPDLMHARLPTIRSSALVLNRNKKNRHSIIFDGYREDERPTAGQEYPRFEREEFERTEVQISEIQEALLLPRRYALKPYKTIIQQLGASQYPVVSLRELVRQTRNGLYQRPHGRDSQDAKEREIRSRKELPESLLAELPVLSASDLNSDGRELELNLSTLTRRALARDRRSIVDFPAIITRTTRKPSSAHFEFTNQAIIISGDVIAFELNERVNPQYLLSQLHSQSTAAQLDSFRNASTQPRLSERDFLELRIILPPFVEQDRQAIEFLKSRQKELQSEILEEKKEVKLAEYDIISIVVHDLNHKLSAIQNDLRNLKAFFDEELADYLDRPITKVFEDDSIEEIDKVRLGRVFERLVRTQTEASLQLAATREVLQNNTVKPILRDFKKWLTKEIKPLYDAKIEFVVEGDEITFDFDSKRFADLIRNLVTNALQHDSSKVVFDLTRRKDGSVRILFKNDGRPFPEDFDFDTHYKVLYQRSSDSTGWGIGGYSINKHVELHSGEMHNVSPKTGDIDPFRVQVEFIFPVTFQENPIYARSNPYSSN